MPLTVLFGPIRVYLVKELLLCVGKHILLFRSSSSGRDIPGRLFARLADQQAVVTPPTGLICPLSFSQFFSKIGQICFVCFCTFYYKLKIYIFTSLEICSFSCFTTKLLLMHLNYLEA